MNLDNVIKKVPDFPKPGILFYDITSLFTNIDAFNYISNKMLELYKDIKIDGVIAIESRGFILGSILAFKKKVPLILARKPGKLPRETIKQNYSLEYGESSLEIHISDISANKQYLIVDDLIATGGTIKAVIDIINKQNATISGIFAIIGLTFLNYKEKFNNYNLSILQEY